MTRIGWRIGCILIWLGSLCRNQRRACLGKWGCAGPVTGRTEKPVTEALARAEIWAAIAMSDGERPNLQQICADLGVEYWPPLAVEQGWAEGVWLALRWLLGEQGLMR